MSTVPVHELKRVHRATWAAGDYAAAAELIAEAPPGDLLAQIDIAPGLDVLDVAVRLSGAFRRLHGEEPRPGAEGA
jgi:hypothetical protein